MNVILCGMPGSGKSYYGKLAAKKLNKNFIDTDELIVSSYFKLTSQQMSCREITLKEGEKYFRCLESQVITELNDVQDSIISLGGGSICNPDNVRILKNLGWIIYLKVDAQIILGRLMSKKFLPSYLSKEDVQGSFDKLLKERLPLYEKNCHYILDVSKEDVLETMSGIVKEL